MGRHRNESGRKNPKNGTCNAYLKEVFGFYRYIEAEYEELGSLKVLLYSGIGKCAVSTISRKSKRSFPSSLSSPSTRVPMSFS